MLKVIVLAASLAFALSPAFAEDRDTHMTNDKGEHAIVHTDDRGTRSLIEGRETAISDRDRHDDHVRDLEKAGFHRDH